jgi:hypothetical protein
MSADARALDGDKIYPVTITFWQVVLLMGLDRSRLSIVEWRLPIADFGIADCRLLI